MLKGQSYPGFCTAVVFWLDIAYLLMKWDNGYIYIINVVKIRHICNLMNSSKVCSVICFSVITCSDAKQTVFKGCLAELVIYSI